eukprot:s1_g2081.t1
MAGCILVRLGEGRDENGHHTVLNSWKAYREIYPLVADATLDGGPVTIEIIDGDREDIVVFREKAPWFAETWFADALVRLIQIIWLDKAPTAKAEFDAMQKETFGPFSIGQLSLAQSEDAQEQAVAEGIERFLQETMSESFLLSEEQAEERDQNVALIQSLQQEAGFEGDMATQGLVGINGAALATAFYERDPEKEETYLRVSPIALTLRMAGLLTRPRGEILDRLIWLYGDRPERQGVRIFSPSIVDFEKWFKDDEPVSPIEDQLEVMAAHARRVRDHVVLNFISFCPLRAALEREKDPQVETLRHVIKAVKEKGFAGVKLYPPMGFKPLGNAGGDFSHAKEVPAHEPGVKIDQELKRLYDWCRANHVPIKAHANNSITAVDGSGCNAAPFNWKPVFENYPGLHVNLAHFGGFEESLSEQGKRQFCGTVDWEDMLAEMIEDSRAEGLYFDTGYWTELADVDDPHHARTVAMTSALLRRHPKLTSRLLYGSDWSMIAKESSHPIYLPSIVSQLPEIGFEVAAINGFMSGNALHYLYLDERSRRETPAPYERLSNFFGPDHAFHRVLNGA